MLITQLTDTKGLECAHDGEIILQQKPKNANNSLVLQSMFMILARLPFLMLCIGLFYPNWTVLGFFLHYRVHLFKFSFRVTDFIHIFFLTLELNPVCKSCMYVPILIYPYCMYVPILISRCIPHVVFPSSPQGIWTKIENLLPLIYWCSKLHTRVAK